MDDPPPPQRLTIWCNARLSEGAEELLRVGAGPHALVRSTFQPGAADALDPSFHDADVALGQPDVGQVIASTKLRWVQITSAGYTRYDRDDVRAALRARGAAMTNSSSVFDDACAQHVLAMMLAVARCLPQALVDQQTTRGWKIHLHGRDNRVLTRQTVLLLGFGAIGRRLAELLAPFRMTVVATRRSPRGDEPIHVVPDTETDAVLPTADHVVDLLPDNPSTRCFMTAARFARMKPSAVFYNIGRGKTVVTSALLAALNDGTIAAAYLDVTDPEPLPPNHPLWQAKNCFITPHTAGGHQGETEHLVRNFLTNLERFRSNQTLLDGVVRS